MKNEISHFPFLKEILSFKSGTDNLSAYIFFKDRTRNSPVLFIIHGSSGPGIEMRRWIQRAVESGYTVVSVDHFIGRGIQKIRYDYKDINPITYFDLANDIKKFLPILEKKYPWSQLEIIGISLGASASLLINNSAVSRVFAFYPSLRPLTKSLLKVYTDNLTVFVGRQDIWTPARDVFYHCSLMSKPYNIITYEDTYHGFLKENCNKVIDVLPLGLITSLEKIVLEDQYYRKYFLDKRFLREFKINPKDYNEKVRLLHNKWATQDSLERFFK